MSLKTYLSGKSSEEIEFQNIIKEIQPKKTQLKTLSGNIPFSKDFSMLAPYNLKVPSNSMTVGTAFDYLARFQVAQVINNNKEDSYSNLVAGRFFELFKDQIDNKTYNKLYEKYNKGLEYINQFVHSSNSIDDELIEIAYFFALLERSKRGRMLSDDLNSYFSNAPEEISEDLVNLTSVFNKCFIKKVVKPDSDAIFNPHFGLCSTSVGGADADIYIDGTLYDFKTSKSKGYVGKDWQQVISYYIFEQINLLNNDILATFNEEHDIKTIAIYLARFGEVIYIDTDFISDELKYQSMKELMNLFSI